MSVKPGNSQEAEQIKTVLRILMQCLNQSYPSKQFVKTLFNKAIYIEPTYDRVLFVKDIHYLLGKGYVEVTGNCLIKGIELFELLIVLTPAGKEIAMQTMIDEAMAI
jgi:hypothetical protein